MLLASGKGVLEVLLRDLAMAPVHAVGQPGKTVRQPEGQWERQSLDDADQHPEEQVDEIIQFPGTRLGHDVTPLTTRPFGGT